MDRPAKPGAPPAPPPPGVGPSPVSTTRRRPTAADGSGPIRAHPTAAGPATAGPGSPGTNRDLAEEFPLAIESQRPPPPADEALLGGRASLTRIQPIGRFGRYELLGRLAYGGMAEIFLAREIAEAGARAGRYVVVKRVLPHVAEDARFVEMFVDEARLAMHLSHPNICHVYAFGQEQGAYYLAMEWVNGMPLSKVHRRARERLGGLPIPIALKVIAQVAEALDHAHRACDAQGEPLGIVHRDVSPQNVMIAFDGPVKLLDFGIAKASSHDNRTEAGIVKGKFAYMSPQQCLGEPIDARADVFALGLCLYELVAGRNPFKRQTEFDTMRAIVYEALPPVADVLAEREPRSEIVEALCEIFERALAKRCEDRFQSAAEMQMAIERVLAGMGEVVTAARIGEVMHELFDAEIKAGPQLDVRSQLPPPSTAPPSSSSGEEPVPPLATPPSHATQRVATAPGDVSAERPISAASRPRSPMRWLLLSAVLILVGVVGAVAATIYTIADTHQALRSQPPIVTPTPLPVSTGPPPVASTGSLYIDSTPAGASIELGERGLVGTTPMEIAMLDPGLWHVRLTLQGFDPWERSLEIRPGDRTHLVATLHESVVSREQSRSSRVGAELRDRRERDPAAGPRPPPAPLGRVSINSRPWSKVYVGSRLLGTTPIGSVDVESGTVRLRLVDRDGVEHVRTITVPPGGHAREFFDLRQDADPSAGGE